MTDQLALGGVVRSFEESSLILDQLRQRLASLASSDEVRQESSSSLQRSAGQLADLTSELSSVAEQLSSVSEQLGDAVALTHVQLAALTPEGLLAALGEQRDGLKAVCERMESLQASTRSSVDALSAELAVSRQIIERQGSELMMIRTKIAGMPERLRRKHALDASPLPPPAP